MFAAIAKAFEQLTDPATRAILWRCLAVTFLLFAGLVFGAEWIIAHSHFFQAAAFNWIANILGGLGAFLLALFLFPSALILVLGFFIEEVAARVDARYYPDSSPIRSQPWGEVVLGSLRFAAVAVGLNLLALPLLAILVFIPPLNLVVFYGLNGYLLGREYCELVALRRMDLRQTRALRHRYAVPIFLAGVLITFLSTVPFLNLLTPVLATAFMVHRVESMRGMVTGLRDVTPQ